MGESVPSDVEADKLEEILTDDASTLVPNDAADPPAIVETKISPDIREKYEIYSYRNAAVVLSESHPQEFGELLGALRDFSITTTMIRTAGGNESDIPKLLSTVLRPLGWYETTIQGDLLVKLLWREQVSTTKAGKPVFGPKSREVRRANYLDGHKIDYAKGKVAFDLEWNSKDQTFDRDLYAFSAFAQCGVIDVAVLVTRSESLNDIFRRLGPSLKKDGSVETKPNGQERLTMEKYGASTTWMGKLLYRLNAGRNGGCPVLAIGITPKCISDWNDDDTA
ncbi:MAG: restriction endonuclease [Alphaproteobacteria bacterium]|nr:restriction endonuclease [Alphaproteobacteria bacterium]